MTTVKLPSSDHTVVQNIFFKMMCFKDRGDCNNGHKHTYDHLTVLSAGSILAVCDGKVGCFRAPHLFLTPKGKVHQFIALEENTLVTCVHALRDPVVSDEIITPDFHPREVCHRGVQQLTDNTTPAADWNVARPWQSFLPMSGEVPDHGYGEQVLTAQCANTSVRIHPLAAVGDTLKVRGAQDEAYSYLGFLSRGAVRIVSAHGVREYQAPHVFVLPQGGGAEISAQVADSVFIEVQTFAGAEFRPDTYHPAITLDDAAARMQPLLQQINDQTSVVIPYDTPAGCATVEATR